MMKCIYSRAGLLFALKSLKAMWSLVSPMGSGRLSGGGNKSCPSCIAEIMGKQNRKFILVGDLDLTFNLAVVVTLRSLKSCPSFIWETVRCRI